MCIGKDWIFVSNVFCLFKLLVGVCVLVIFGCLFMGYVWVILGLEVVGGGVVGELVEFMECIVWWVVSCEMLVC